jgi:diadenylate cyclase
MARRNDALHAALSNVAPGKPLREGLDRIVRAKMGALVVIGDGPEVLGICSGGFLLDAAFSPQRMSELAKMDGAIIVSADASRIARANVHLVPDPLTPTGETGTRHRTGERVARSLGVPVVTVSEDMSVITVYTGTSRHVLDESSHLLGRANQALATLERYAARLDDVSGSLSALEVEDLVTVRDVAMVLQRTEMVQRIADEIDGYIVELGVDARLVRLQLEELLGDGADDRALVLADYLPGGVAAGLDALSALETDALVDLTEVARAAGLSDELDRPVTSRGQRLLAKVPRLDAQVAARVVARYVDLQQLMRATVDDLASIEGVEDDDARVVKDGLARLAETSILDRYR